ncbi:hypothetical protein ACFCX4_15935 [Kitasatospora sp. NPDC056327]|uniref:hypothetical protein n=1 Tax=Kitasatospora sp. NPDC056327 TaxID=3345785 RepID=UPI0035DED3C5
MTSPVAGARTAPPAAGFRTARERRRLRGWERRVRSAGLPPLWEGRCTALSEPSRRAAAVRHTAATLAALPKPYRLVFALLMRVFPVAVLLADPPGAVRATAVRVSARRSGARRSGADRGGADRGRPRLVADRLSAVPGCAELLRVSLALALHGALDGTPGPTPSGVPDGTPGGPAAAPRRGLR